jgi:hypothetical protein
VPTEDELTILLDELLASVDKYVAQPYWAARDYLVGVRAGQLPFDAQRFANDIAPLIEIAVSWQQLANDGTHAHFLKHCKTRVRHSTDFRGTVFELLTASRVALSGAKWGWAEDRELIASHHGGVVDFWVTESEGTVAVECTTRHQEVELDLRHVQQAVDDKARTKFADLSYLPQPVARSVIFYELTRSGFVEPAVRQTVDELLLPDSVGAVCLTWRELFDVDGGYSLHPRFHWLGKPVPVCSLAVEVRFRGQVFVRKHVEPEPLFGLWGPEETIGKD